MPYSLTQLNAAVRTDPRAFVEECDAAYAKKVQAAAEKIAEHRGESRIILLSGPSGSGKTTTALKIEEQMERMCGCRFRHVGHVVRHCWSMKSWRNMM